jgi:glutamine synthetase
MPTWQFKGSDLLSGEADGSSFMHGGMRDTHQAGAYLSIDPTSPIFLRGDTVFVPACLVSYNGVALDEKVTIR